MLRPVSTLGRAARRGTSPARALLRALRHGPEVKEGRPGERALRNAKWQWLHSGCALAFFALRGPHIDAGPRLHGHSDVDQFHVPIAEGRV